MLPVVEIHGHDFSLMVRMLTQDIVTAESVLVIEGVNSSAVHSYLGGEKRLRCELLYQKEGFRKSLQSPYDVLSRE